ncbi:hypothetical protein FF38_12248 [Lucilia cuprina]|uniref:Uncharacterized protein n=1 Tax=Lucilia cuprina TaxID=7375 RepID=A0A0L0C9R9_LUCCU|nr:hypothetical protein FF38_12248 [Lucilia cuprina]
MRVERTHHLGAGHQPQVHRQQHDLQKHQQGRGSKQPRTCTASQASEHNHVIHTRRQQHEQHPNEHRLISRHGATQPEHDHRHDDEVQDEHDAQEPPIREGPADRRERHPQERRVQQQPEHGIDRRLERIRHRRHEALPDAAPTTPQLCTRAQACRM